MRKFKLPENVKIVEKFKYFICVSLAVILAGLVFMIVRGMNFGVDFAGGARIEIETDTSVTIETVTKAVNESIEGEYTLSGAVQASPSDGYVTYEATLKYPSNVDESKFVEAIQGELAQKIADKLGIDVSKVNAYTVGATASQSLIRSAIIALSVAIVVMLIYIVIRFTLSSALASVCALIHDVLIMIALTTIFHVPVNSTFIAAVITIVGYSINATIIIFDRIREERKSIANEELSDVEIANSSIVKTMGRTILTTLTTLIMVVMLAIFSVSTIREFIIPIIFGLIAGTYSSVVLASGFWVLFRKLGRKIQEKRAQKKSYSGTQSR